MTRYSLKQNAVASCEEKKGLLSVSDPRSSVVCPKPRRLGHQVNDPIRPMRWNISHQAVIYDSKAGMDLLDFIPMKDGEWGTSIWIPGGH